MAEQTVKTTVTDDAGTERETSGFFGGIGRFASGVVLKTASVLFLRQWSDLNEAADSRLKSVSKQLEADPTGVGSLAHKVATAPLSVASGAVDRVSSSIAGTAMDKDEERNKRAESDAAANEPIDHFDELAWSWAGLATLPVDALHEFVLSPEKETVAPGGVSKSLAEAGTKIGSENQPAEREKAPIKQNGRE